MLEIKHLTKAYERVILKDVCLSFKEKGLYVITGKSGCGKSTLLNMIGGLDSNYQGIIEMDGRDIHNASADYPYVAEQFLVIFKNM